MASVDHSSSRAGELVRQLGGVERWFSYLNDNHPCHFSTVAELLGDVTADRCRTALAALQQRHPLLNVAIAHDQQGELVFQRAKAGDESRIPLRVCDSATTSWQKEVADETVRPFDSRVAPLMRAVLLTGASQSAVILVAHHSIGDGMAVMYAMRDLVRALSGEPLAAMALPPNVEQLHAINLARTSATSQAVVQKQDQSTETTESTPPAPRPAPFRTHTASARPAIQCKLLKKAQTDALTGACRRHGVTVHAALTAALVLAGRRLATAWRDLPVRVFTPTNIRPILAAGEAYHDCVSGGAVQLSPSSTASLWDTAVQAYKDLLVFRSPAGYFIIDQMIGDHSSDSETVLSFTTDHLGFELMVTNPGRVEFDLPATSSVSVVALHGPCVLFGFQSEQSVAAVSTNGSLSLTHCSFDPIDGLLELAVQLLSAAVDSNDQ